MLLADPPGLIPGFVTQVHLENDTKTTDDTILSSLLSTEFAGESQRLSSTEWTIYEYDQRVKKSSSE